MCPIAYYEMIRNTDNPEYFRLKVVQFARQHGIKPAAKAFQMTPRSVRKWVRRYDGTLASLKDRSRAPHRRPRKISAELEAHIVRLKRQLPTWGAARLKRDFALPCSDKAIARVYRKYGLTQPRRRKHRVKHDLRAIKQQWRLFQQIDMDTKALSDIPEYWPAMMRLGLPRFQYTAREVVSGLTFIAYGQECCLTYAALFADRLLKHLKECGVQLSEVTVQTDNGSEFIGSWQSREPSAFTKVVEQAYGATHHSIPPGAHTYQSDVETFHGTIEKELFIIEPFFNRRDFLGKVKAYQLLYNYARANSSKGNRTPMQIIRERDPRIAGKVGLLLPVFLDSLLPRANATGPPAPEALGPHDRYQLHNTLRSCPKGGYHVCTQPYPPTNGEVALKPCLLVSAAR